MSNRNNHNAASSRSLESPSRSQMSEYVDDSPVNDHLENTIGDVIARRYNRRSVLKGLLGSAAIGAVSMAGLSQASHAETLGGSGQGTAAEGVADGRYNFQEIAGGVDTTHHVAKGYNADILLRWGDPLFEDSPAFDPYKQTVASQLKQFGYNNDFIGFHPLNKEGSRGLLCVNHEYTIDELMFPGLGNLAKYDFTGITKELTEIEMAAHGGTVVEIVKQEDGGWKPNIASPLNRRITAFDTPMVLDGPAAGHSLLQTSEDPEGQNVIGTINNCAGGMTPWGTYLMAEENFHLNFYTDQVKKSGKPKKGLGGDQKIAFKRYRMPGQFHAWGKYHKRFNIDQEPNESNRFGWIVEVDILNPESKPVKHTAMGRFCHEGCENIITPSGHCVVYMGDDTKFEYLYKFVSKNTYKPDHGDAALRKANLSLLSEGILYVARFNDDGSLDWLPLIHGQNGLNAENGFPSQADILIHTRMAADHLGATPMDRPEDVEPGTDGKVYVMLTNNSKRNNTKKPERHTNKANPREKNLFGHIIEITEDNADNTSLKGKWDIMISCGDPKIAAVGARWHPKTSENGWFGSPDNCAIDAKGRLWVSTDQGANWRKTGKADGLYGVETQGEKRGMSKLFFRVPVGAELCGPRFTPDLETLFLAVQHPASDGVEDFPGFNRQSTFEDPATRWPDFNDKMPPRPSVVMVTKKGGGQIG